MYHSFLSKTQLLSFLFLVLFNCSIAQTKYGGIEIGSKGVKITVVNFKNIKKSIYTLDKFWTENTGIAKGIAITGNLNPEDIETTSNIVLANYNKLQAEYKIDKKRIFIVASSGVAMAKNTNVLVEKIKQLTEKDLDIITSNAEAKLLAQGGIPPKQYLKSTIIDIGAGNTKGGYVESFNGKSLVFMPLVLDLGTVTLTEKMRKKAHSDDFNDILMESLKFKDSLNFLFKKMYNVQPKSTKRKNIYLSGGAVWTFVTLTSEKTSDSYYKFTLKDVTDYQQKLLSDYAYFENLAKSNQDADRVIKTYSREYLISANNLLLSTINNLDKPKNKNFYFLKQGQITWLLGYVVEKSKYGKHIY